MNKTKQPEKPKNREQPKKPQKKLFERGETIITSVQ